jgi:hypothetical protein
MWAEGDVEHDSPLVIGIMDCLKRVKLAGHWAIFGRNPAPVRRYSRATFLEFPPAGLYQNGAVPVNPGNSEDPDHPPVFLLHDVRVKAAFPAAFLTGLREDQTHAVPSP